MDFLFSSAVRQLCVSCSLIETWDLKICVLFILCCYGETKLNSMVFAALIRLRGFINAFYVVRKI